MKKVALTPSSFSASSFFGVGVGAVIESERDDMGLGRAGMEDVALLEQGKLGIAVFLAVRDPVRQNQQARASANAIFRMNTRMKVRLSNLTYHWPAHLQRALAYRADYPLDFEANLGRAGS